MSGTIGPEHKKLGATVRSPGDERAVSQEALGFAAELHRNYVGATRYEQPAGARPARRVRLAP
jgi:hypothetical protein